MKKIMNKIRNFLLIFFSFIFVSSVFYTVYIMWKEDIEIKTAIEAMTWLYKEVKEDMTEK